MDVSELKLCPGRVYQWHPRGESRIISEGGGVGGGGWFDLIKLQYLFYVFVHTKLCKQCRPRSDAAFGTHSAI